MKGKRDQFHYKLDELIERIEQGDEVNILPALLGLAYEIRENQDEFITYVDQERGYLA